MESSPIQKTCKVLESLYEGNTVKMLGQSYCMNEDNEIGMELYDENGESNDMVLTLDVTLNGFIKMCNSLSELDFLLIMTDKVSNGKLI